MTTTIKKTFMDIQKEVDWLNLQGENGLMLVGYRGGEYEFEDVSPARYRYAIDLPNYSGGRKKRYLSFLENSGITVAAKFGGRLYLRRNAEEGPLELYTDNKQLNKQISKRYTYLIVIGTSQISAGILLLIQMMNYFAAKSAPFWICSVSGTLFVISGLVFLVTGIRKQKEHAINKEDLDVWE